MSSYKICLSAVSVATFINVHTHTHTHIAAVGRQGVSVLWGGRRVVGDCDFVSHTSVPPKSKWNYFAICYMNCIYSRVCVHICVCVCACVSIGQKASTVIYVWKEALALQTLKQAIAHTLTRICVWLQWLCSKYSANSCVNLRQELEGQQALVCNAMRSELTAIQEKMRILRTLVVLEFKCT